jgi:hypothetical protein
MVLDGEPEMAVSRRGGDHYRMSSVAERIRDQVGDDAVECVRVPAHQESGIDLKLDLVGSPGGHAAHDLFGSFANCQRRARDGARPRLETREVE